MSRQAAGRCVANISPVSPRSPSTRTVSRASAGSPMGAAARVEDSRRAASRADRDGDGVGDGKEGKERILHDARGAARGAGEPLVLEGLAHEPFPGLDRDAVEVVPAKPATGARHEPRG